MRLNQRETTLFTFEKSEREQLRVSETLYLDREYIDIRVFARKAGAFYPTAKGITFSKSFMPRLTEALNKIA